MLTELPNGEEFVFSASELGHGIRIYKASIRGGPARAMTAEGVVTARTGVSPDGKWLPATELSTGRILLYPVDGGEPQAVTGMFRDERIAGWTADTKGLFVYKTDETTIPLSRIDLRSGQRKLIREIERIDRAGVSGLSTLLITPDATTYAYSLPQTLSDLYLVKGLK